MSKIKLSAKFLTVNGVRCGVQIDGPGGWVNGVDPRTIKIRCKAGIFPAAIRQAFAVENNSDILTDYFEGDCLRLLPGHPLYDEAKAAA